MSLVRPSYRDFQPVNKEHHIGHLLAPSTKRLYRCNASAKSVDSLEPPTHHYKEHTLHKRIHTTTTHPSIHSSPITLHPQPD